MQAPKWLGHSTFVSQVLRCLIDVEKVSVGVYRRRGLVLPAGDACLRWWPNSVGVHLAVAGQRETVATRGAVVGQSIEQRRL
jgi:hypothetical protein